MKKKIEKNENEGTEKEEGRENQRRNERNAAHSTERLTQKHDEPHEKKKKTTTTTQIPSKKCPPSAERERTRKRWAIRTKVARNGPRRTHAFDRLTRRGPSIGNANQQGRNNPTVDETTTNARTSDAKKPGTGAGTQKGGSHVGHAPPKTNGQGAGRGAANAGNRNTNRTVRQHRAHANGTRYERDE